MVTFEALEVMQQELAKLQARVQKEQARNDKLERELKEVHSELDSDAGGYI